MTGIFKKYVIILILIFVWPLNTMAYQDVARSVKKQTEEVYRKGLDFIGKFKENREKIQLQELLKKELIDIEKVVGDFYRDKIRGPQAEDRELNSELENQKKHLQELDETLEKLKRDKSQLLKNKEGLENQLGVQGVKKSDVAKLGSVERAEWGEATNEKLVGAIKVDILHAIQDVSEGVVKLLPSDRKQHDDCLRILFNFVHKVTQALYPDNIPFYAYVGVNEDEKIAVKERRNDLENQIKQELRAISYGGKTKIARSSEKILLPVDQWPTTIDAVRSTKYVIGNIEYDHDYDNLRKSFCVYILTVLAELKQDLPLNLSDYKKKRDAAFAKVLSGLKQDDEAMRLPGVLDNILMRENIAQDEERPILSKTNREKGAHETSSEDVDDVVKEFVTYVAACEAGPFTDEMIERLVSIVLPNSKISEDDKAIVDVLGKEKLEEYANKFDVMINKEFYTKMKSEHESFALDRAFQMYEIEIGILKNVVERLWKNEFSGNLKTAFDSAASAIGSIKAGLSKKNNVSEFEKEAGHVIKELHEFLLRTLPCATKPSIDDSSERIKNFIRVCDEKLHPLFRSLFDKKVMGMAEFRNHYQSESYYQKSSDFLNFLVIAGLGFFLIDFLYNQSMVSDVHQFLTLLLATNTIKPIYYFFDLDFPTEFVAKRVSGSVDDTMQYIKGLKALPVQLKELHTFEKFEEALKDLSTYIYTFDAQRVMDVTPEIVYAWLLHESPRASSESIKKMFDLIETRGNLQENQRKDFAAVDELLDGIVNAHDLGDQINLVSSFIVAEKLSENNGAFVIAVLVYLCNRFHAQKDQAQLRELFHTVVQKIFRCKWLSQQPLQMAFCCSLFLLTSDTIKVEELNTTLNVFRELVPFIKNENERGFVGIKGLLKKNLVLWSERLIVEQKSDGPLGFDEQYLNTVLSSVGVFNALDIMENPLTDSLTKAKTSITQMVGTCNVEFGKDEINEESARAAMSALVDLLGKAGSEQNKRLLLPGGAYDDVSLLVLDLLKEYPFLRNGELLDKAKVFFAQDEKDLYRTAAAAINVWKFVFTRSDKPQSKDDIEKQVAAMVNKDGFEDLYSSFFLQDRQRLADQITRKLVDLKVLSKSDIPRVIGLSEKLKSGKTQLDALEKSQPILKTRIEQLAVDIERLQTEKTDAEQLRLPLEKAINELTSAREAILNENVEYKRAQELVADKRIEKAKIKAFYDAVVLAGKEEDILFKRELAKKQLTKNDLENIVADFVNLLQGPYQEMSGYLNTVDAVAQDFEEVAQLLDEFKKKPRETNWNKDILPSIEKFCAAIDDSDKRNRAINLFKSANDFFDDAMVKFEKAVWQVLTYDLLKNDTEVKKVVGMYQPRQMQSVVIKMAENLKEHHTKFKGMVGPLKGMRVPSKFYTKIDEEIVPYLEALYAELTKFKAHYDRLKSDSQALFELLKNKLLAILGKWESIESSLNDSLRVVTEIEDREASKIKKINDEILHKKAELGVFDSDFRILKKTLDEKEGALQQTQKQIDDNREMMEQLKITTIPLLGQLIGIVDNFDLIDRSVMKLKPDLKKTLPEEVHPAVAEPAKVEKKPVSQKRKKK